MMLPPPIRGFRSRHINALLRAVEAARPLPGANVTVRETPQGTYIDAEPGGGTAAPTPAATLPWTVALREAADGTAWWCVYDPSWAATLPFADPDAGERPDPWACAVAAVTLRPEAYAVEGIPAPWRPLLTDAQIQAGTDAWCAWATYLHPDAAPTSGAGALGLDVGDFTGHARAGVTLEEGAWILPFAELVVPTGGGAKTLRNLNVGTLRNTLSAGACAIRRQPVNAFGIPTGDWQEIPAGAEVSADFRYALTEWWQADLVWGDAPYAVGLGALGLARSGVLCVSHLSDHLAGAI